MKLSTNDNPGYIPGLHSITMAPVDQVVLVRIKIPGAVGGGETAGAARRIVILNNNLSHTESVCIDNHRYQIWAAYIDTMMMTV